MTKSVKVTSEETVTITMTKEHAITLLDVLWKVGGSTITTPRGLIDDISGALDEAGYHVHDVEWRRQNIDGSIYFMDVPNKVSDEES